MRAVRRRIELRWSDMVSKAAVEGGEGSKCGVRSGGGGFKQTEGQHTVQSIDSSPTGPREEIEEMQTQGTAAGRQQTHGRTRQLCPISPVDYTILTFFRRVRALQHRVCVPVKTRHTMAHDLPFSALFSATGVLPSQHQLASCCAAACVKDQGPCRHMATLGTMVMETRRHASVWHLGEQLSVNYRRCLEHVER